MATEDGRGDAIIAPKLDLFNDEFSAGKPDTNIVATEDGEVEVTEVEPGVRAPVAKAAAGKVTRTVDLGDGSGKQVFSADTAEALLDVMTKAQENATRKIRELAFEQKRTVRATPDRTPVATSSKKELSADELFAIANEIQRNPTAAIDKIFLSQVGKTPAQIGEFISNLELQQAVNAADQTFMANHKEDFIPNAQNGARMLKFLADEKLQHTAANLEYAFQELTEGGLLDVAAEPEDATGKVKVASHVRQKPMSLGLQNKNASARSVDPAIESKTISESEVEQIYKLPAEEARVLMNKLMAKAKAAQARTA
jgi:hypothetical protein